jgi:hypothetical protein
MPFIPPPTYASKATTGYLATFSIGTSASPPNFIPVVEVKSIQPTLIDVPQVQTSHLQSVGNTEEFIPGMIKPGTVKVTGQFIGDTTHLQFLTLAQSQAFFPWEIVANMQRNLKTYTCSGNGYIAKYDPGPFENNRPIEFSMDLQISGAISEVVS